MSTIDELFEEGYSKEEIIAMVNAANAKREANKKNIKVAHNDLVDAMTNYCAEIGMLKDTSEEEKKAFADFTHDVLTNIEENLDAIRAEWEKIDNKSASKKETFPKPPLRKTKTSSDDEALNAFLASLL